MMMAMSVQPINEWLSTYSKPSTRRVFGVGVKQFLSYIYQIPITSENEIFEKFASQYINECQSGGRDWFKDLLSFAASFANKPPKTVHSYVSAAKNWLMFSLNVELTRKQEQFLRGRLPKGKRARTVEDDLTKEKLKRILTHCDVKGKALFLLLSSSGIRVNEALQLSLDDIKWDSEPVEITVRGEYTKTGDAYYSFITREAKDALLEWLKVREDYLKSAKNRGRGLAKFSDGRGLKSVADDRVFPFDYVVATQMWNNALRKAGLENHDKTTDRRTLHIHMLRKYFLSRIKLVVPKEIAEALAGHEEGLDYAYRRYTKDEIREWYMKAEPYLYVFVPEDISTIQTTFSGQLIKLKDQLTDLLYQNQKLIMEKEELKKRIERFESVIQRFMNISFEDLEEMVNEWRKKRIQKEAEKHRETYEEDSRLAHGTQKKFKESESLIQNPNSF